MNARASAGPPGSEQAIPKLDGRWKLVILFHLFGRKTLPFSDLEGDPGISQKMLPQQLHRKSRTGVGGAATLSLRSSL